MTGAGVGGFGVLKVHGSLTEIENITNGHSWPLLHLMHAKSVYWLLCMAATST